MVLTDRVFTHWRQWVLLLSVFLVSACAQVSVYEDKDYYRMVETKTTSQRAGYSLAETREIFCPSGRIPRGEDPTFWTDDHLTLQLKEKHCLRIICHTDLQGQRKCASQGDEKLRSDLESERAKVTPRKGG